MDTSTTRLAGTFSMLSWLPFLFVWQLFPSQLCSLSFVVPFFDTFNCSCSSSSTFFRVQLSPLLAVKISRNCASFFLNWLASSVTFSLHPFWFPDFYSIAFSGKRQYRCHRVYCRWWRINRGQWFNELDSALAMWTRDSVNDDSLIGRNQKINGCCVDLSWPKQGIVGGMAGLQCDAQQCRLNRHNLSCWWSLWS